MDIKFGYYIHTHAVFGNHGLLFDALDLQAQGAHIYIDHLMQSGYNQRTAGFGYFLPTQTGAYKGDFFAGTLEENEEQHNKYYRQQDKKSDDR